MKDMTAIAITTPGGPEVLTPVTLPVPVPKPGEILVKVKAAGVNRPDVLQRQGGYPPPPGAPDTPGLEIAGEVVALGDGIDFLLQDAVDDGNYPFELLIEPLAAEGVEFRICRNSMESRKVEPARVLQQVTIVPSGIAEIVRLQAREGHAYVKP